ncbi:MAG: winged helix-turn-helix transcriptional regulator [Geodermatophilaceae bacterium]|nr:winged helix-turn-helix transcriptional regulator [Geodermatophilaceae bacterium]
MLGQAYSLLGFRIVDGVVGSGHPIKPSHSVVFAQIEPGGSRLTKLAAGANITPQSMGVIVDELEDLGYVERRPDPSDRRAKLITLTARGHDAVAAGKATITGLEEDLVAILGERGAQQLRRLLSRILASGSQVRRSTKT